MAKMFYTLDEAKAALGKNEEEIKQLTREGKLREFRDGNRVMFKADQVEALKGEAGDQVDLGPSDSGLPIGLVDSKSASGSVISLADSDGGPANPASPPKEDTALAADLNLAGSVGGVPSPGRLGGSSAGSRLGVNVFGTDEVPAIDPAAQTSISAGAQQQQNLDSVGSGSGLLDLTRESDDTSLGAELLDEISPGSKRAAGETAAGEALATLEEPKGGVTRVAGPALVEAADPMAPAFAGAALAAAAMLLFGAFVVLSAVAGTCPEFVRNLGSYGQPLAVIAGVGVVLSAIGFVGGLVIGKAAR